MLIKSDPIDSSANYVDYYINLAFKVNVAYEQIQPKAIEQKDPCLNSPRAGKYLNGFGATFR